MGHFCTAGAVTQADCPAGTYNPATGLYFFLFLTLSDLITAGICVLSVIITPQTFLHSNSYCKKLSSFDRQSDRFEDTNSNNCG